MDALRRYNILASFDRAKIERELGEHYNNMGEVNEAMSAAYKLLTPPQKAADYARAESELSAMASVLGRRAAGKPKKFSDAELARRTERIKAAKRWTEKD